MASSPRILLILFEGLPGTVIESQVLVHAREMARLGIAEFEIWTFACSAPLYRRSIAALPRARALANCPVRVFRGVRPAMPFSTMLNALAVAAAMMRYRPGIGLVHARTDYSAAVMAHLRRWHRHAVIWDCRGDSVAEFAERFRTKRGLHRLAGAIRLRLLARDRRRAAQSCDRAIFVAGALEAIAAPEIVDKPRRVIPCTASDALFYFDAETRKAARRDLGFAPTDPVYIFSGSLAPYQCFDRSLSLFAEIQAGNPDAKLLVLTPEQEEARRRIAAIAHVRNVVLRSAPIADMNRYLNAADAAFMLREPTAVNRAAFPTKFAEYCLVGLPVVMTQAVPDAYDVAVRLGNLLPPTAAGLKDLPAGYDRRRVAADARACLTRVSVAAQYAAIYRGPQP